MAVVKDLIEQEGFKISSIDTVVIAQEPALLPFKKQIKEKVAQILEIDADCLNIKAKTNEGLGELGRKEAIASYAVATLSKEG